ncbi:hypothetical protein BJ508DRAFT_308406 [Ascobolus immersus RN42]|uniref:Uncharacterized protein n=1 Tax=Ascobolus immersus RN42 TaxID=1160509 RepID=A0A3N4I544_ASCIM|nr:hypothetical protein BJ508DRAFT_308406 [Ascobolus immersus RN42]
MLLNEQHFIQPAPDQKFIFQLHVESQYCRSSQTLYQAYRNFQLLVSRPETLDAGSPVEEAQGTSTRFHCHSQLQPPQLTSGFNTSYKPFIYNSNSSNAYRNSRLWGWKMSTLAPARAQEMHRPEQNSHHNHHASSSMEVIWENGQNINDLHNIESQKEKLIQDTKRRTKGHRHKLSISPAQYQGLEFRLMAAAATAFHLAISAFSTATLAAAITASEAPAA